ncbi:HAD family hydrolase [Alteromonas lipolytica]|uniref:Haloacid dehalogenase n=1 Tax=Alteromonas lipolytica TaxID=1856405 RepID=A0A1E8FEY1_9ALTE|nr:HAD family phosphatase [Alteromonas lipolytica]OFI34482.1 hypothetical protein BFC17_17765 [Alteromonas lipolytica]GGF84921.1 haloacid dehalogenase [Alteromonas lipolytica]
MQHKQALDVQAVLFDHDGTLINSEAVHFALWQETLRPHNVELTDAYYNQTMAGVPTTQNGIDVVNDFGLTIDPAELASTKASLTEAHLRKQPFPLMPGAEETFALCRKLGLRTAIVTGGSRFSVERTLESYGFADIVECVVAVDDVVNSKPAPDCYLMALEQMQLTASQVVAVEDTEHGLASAVAAGIRCVTIPTQQSAGHDFSAASAVYTSLSEWTANELNR